MSIQPDVVLAACPVCGDPTVKLDHVHKCVAELKRKTTHYKAALEEIARQRDPITDDEPIVDALLRIARKALLAIVEIKNA